jgi:hypothetical protein
MLAVTLFVIYFCVAALLIYEPDTKAIKAPTTFESKSFDSFYQSVKEAIGSSSVPIDAQEADPWEISPQPTPEPLPEPKPKASQFSIQRLRKLVCQRGLQGSLGKPVNRCRKEELFAVLFA